jgi:hypothetical protein
MVQGASVVDEPGKEQGPFSGLTGLFQQLAGPFSDLRSFEELSTWGSRTALEALFENARSGLIGRRVDTRIGNDRLAFTLSALDARLDPMATAVGQADDVSLAARDVEWSGVHFTEVTATLDNVHTRVGTRPALVCAPIDLTAVVASEQAISFLTRRLPKLSARCVDAGQVRLRLRRHPTWGWIDVRVAALSGQVTLQPLAVGWRKRSWRFKRRLPSKAIALKLPDNARITGLDVEPSGLTIKVRIDQWRLEYNQILGLVRRNR